MRRRGIAPSCRHEPPSPRFGERADTHTPSRESRQAGGHTARRLAHENCRNGAEVALWKLTGAGHGWPGGESNLEALLGPATRVIDASTEIWKFFSRFSGIR